MYENPPYPSIHTMSKYEKRFVCRSDLIQVVALYCSWVGTTRIRIDFETILVDIIGQHFIWGLMYENPPYPSIQTMSKYEKMFVCRSDLIQVVALYCSWVGTTRI